MSTNQAASVTRCNCHALRQAMRRVTQLYDHALAPAGLRVTQFSLLARLHELGPMSMKALAEALVMDRATLGHNLRPLEAEGLVVVAVGKDRRSRLVTLTPEGRKTVVVAYQQRKAEELQHPATGDKVPWGLVPHVQAAETEITRA